MKNNQINLNIEYQGNDQKNQNFHKDIIDVKYPQFYICAKKGSGKSNLILNMIKKFSIPYFTEILYISPTLQYDYCYKQCISDIRKFNKFKINEFDQEVIMDFLNKDKNEFFDKIKYNAIPKILVIDDCRQFLKDKFTSMISTINRHKKCMIIFAGHNLTDILIDMRSQMDALIIFKGQSQMHLQRIYEDYVKDCYKLPFQLFEQIYQKVTDQNHDFLFFDIFSQTLKKNLNQKIQIQ